METEKSLGDDPSGVYRAGAIISKSKLIAPVKYPALKLPVKENWPFGAGQGFLGRETLALNQT
jgi:hypothetical protein